MGEKIKVIDTVNLENMKFDVELNDGSAASKKPLHIHLQNDRFRLDLPDYSFMQMAIAVCTAKRKLVEKKGLKDE